MTATMVYKPFFLALVFGIELILQHKVKKLTHIEEI